MKNHPPLPTKNTLGHRIPSGGRSNGNKTSALLKAALMAVLRENRNFTPTIKDIPQWEAATEVGADNDNDHVLRSILGDVLIATQMTWKKSTMDLIDEIWKAESAAAPKVDARTIPVYRRYKNVDLVLWRGDITTLSPSSTSSDQNDLAIVNAANEQALGCFIPNHKCIDNVIHRRAGPGLRMECHDIMENNRHGTPLKAGSPPLVTSAYHLPCRNVIHVTGPQVNKSRTSSTSSTVDEKDRTLLEASYRNVLDAASAISEIRILAIPCISTGLFGFPQPQATDIALSTVEKWIDDNHSPTTMDDDDGNDVPARGGLDRIIFNVFTDTDLELYQQKFPNYFVPPEDMAGNDDGDVQMSVEDALSDTTTIRTKMLDLAKAWIDDADGVLICAGAGMSVKEGEMVYTNPIDFANHYPWFMAGNKWGYKTSYETMGLLSDPSVPPTAKWALFAKHMDNMRWTFTPNVGYQHLLNGLVGTKDYFVLTSNVDGCFERSGFDPNKIYTPQGEWTYLQCTKPCAADSVYEARPYLDAILPHISNEGFIPDRLIPKCPRCGSDMFGNVRGGNWFLHHSRWERQNVALQEWMEQYATGDKKDKKVVILEIGAGFNTPTVTRFPVEAFARELGNDNGRSTFIRINPSDGEVPEDLRAISLPDGWQVLEEIAAARPGWVPYTTAPTDTSVHQVEEEVRAYLKEEGMLQPNMVTARVLRHFGRRFSWRDFLNQLRNRHH